MIPPHWLQAGPTSIPLRRAGTTGGVSVSAAVAGCASTLVTSMLAPPLVGPAVSPAQML